MITKKQLKQIVKLHRIWYNNLCVPGRHGERANFDGQDLSGMCFDNLNLKMATFIGAKLVGATFYYTQLQNAKFQGADLTNAEFGGAQLEMTNFNNCILKNTCFMTAFIRSTHFNGAKCENVDFDYSAFPLSCGSLDMNVDKRFFAQLAYHMCRLNIKDVECKKAQKALKKIANTFHRVGELRKLK